MIDYHTDRLGVFFIFRWRGSVFPLSCIWGALSALFCVCFHTFFREELGGSSGSTSLWNGWNLILGFLCIFRTQQAYSRFWEGSCLMHQIRGEWLNAVSSLMAFCSHDHEKHAAVKRFQHLAVRLMSMLHCAALQDVAKMKDEAFEIIENDGIDPESLKYLVDSREKVEIIVLWLQRMIVEADIQKVLIVPPPVLTRAFQELSRGVVNLNNCKKIMEIPFPFPYAQMLSVMLLIHFTITPMINSLEFEHASWAGIATFCNVFALWSINYIAIEIEQPFGDDANDLPVADLQIAMNESLMTLLQARSQKVPAYDFDVSTREVESPHRLATRRCSAWEFRARGKKRSRGGTLLRSLSRVSGRLSKCTEFSGESHRFAGHKSHDSEQVMVVRNFSGIHPESSPARETSFSTREAEADCRLVGAWEPVETHGRGDNLMRIHSGASEKKLVVVGSRDDRGARLERSISPGKVVVNGSRDDRGTIVETNIPAGSVKAADDNSNAEQGKFAGNMSPRTIGILEPTSLQTQIDT